jgi:hypothetical protein
MSITKVAAAAGTIDRIDAALADQELSKPARLVLGQLRHYGVTLKANPDGSVDTLQLSNDLRAAGVTPAKRIELKSLLHCAAIID